MKKFRITSQRKGEFYEIQDVFINSSFDGGLMYHSLRQFAEAPLTAAEAQSRLPEGLTADQGHMTLVRSPGGGELLCYAFLCETPEGDALRILVRADNGALWELLPQPGQ